MGGTYSTQGIDEKTCEKFYSDNVKEKDYL
jgi:hypothetical protein